MKGNLKLWLFGSMSVIGLGVCVFSLVYYHVFLAMAAVGLVYIGTTYFIRELKKIKDPKKYESEHIEEIDERNVLMKYKAGYISGKILLGISMIFLVLENYGYADAKIWTFSSAALLWFFLHAILYAKYKYI